MDLQLQLPPETRVLLGVLHDALRSGWFVLPGVPAGEVLTVGAVGGVPDDRAAPVPENLRGRRVELIVEASDVTALRQAVSSDADAVVIDFDDTFAPTWQNVQAAYDALVEVGKLRPEKALLVRPRALYATEPHLNFNGPAIAALCDLGVALMALRGNPPHIYIPKLETVQEAHFWHEALALVERHLGWPVNTVRVCLQIETFSGLLHAEALLHALRGRAYGLNAGRWDYVFSLIKHLGGRTQPVPPRRELGMEVDAMRVYAVELVRVCRRFGAEAIGGTASLSPDPVDPRPALEAVLLDKQREASQGFTAAWAGLPELLGVVREGFGGAAQGHTVEDMQSVEKLPDLYARLTDLPVPDFVAVADVQDAVSLALSVFTAWYAGQGVVQRLGRIEDTATAELARAQLWQWVHVRALLDDGTRLTPERYLRERQGLHSENDRASRLLDTLVLSEGCPDYFPRVAQQLAALDAPEIKVTETGVTP